MKNGLNTSQNEISKSDHSIQNQHFTFMAIEYQILPIGIIVEYFIFIK